MEQPLTGSFELIKNLNTACILNKIRVEKTISRAEIARGTGLTPATVSNITSELIDLGLIEETERGESNGGRKPVLISIKKDTCYFGGICLSSDTVKAAVSDIEAETLSEFRAPIDGASPEKVVSLAVELLTRAKEKANVKKLVGIGVSTHGLVYSDTGMMVFAPNLGWSNVNIGEMLNKATGLPVFVENDVKSMALAESWCGLACGVSDFVYLYIGPGIGGSIVNNNQIFKGPGTFAGEFGHVTIEPDGPLCSCGNRGCLQALASEMAVLQRYRKRKAEQRITPHVNNFEELLQSVQDGDSDAKEEILKSIRYIGIEVGNIINTLSPKLIVLNGKITRLAKMFMPVLEEEIKSRSMKYSGSDVRIAFSQLGDEAAIKGAAANVIRKLFESPRKFLNPIIK